MTIKVRIIIEITIMRNLVIERDKIEIKGIKGIEMGTIMIKMIYMYL